MLFSLLCTQPFSFWKDHNRNAATLFFCVIPAMTPNIEYIKIRLEKFHLITTLFFCVIPDMAPNIEYIKIRLEKFHLIM